MKTHMQMWLTALVASLVVSNAVASVALALPQDWDQLIDNTIDDIDPETPPPGDPDRDCTGATRTFTLDDTALADARALLQGTRIQISHTQQGVPIVGEERTIDLRGGIPAYKFDQLMQAQEARCAQTPNPDACFLNWLQQMSETAVHTITPRYHSYIEWGSFLQLAGLDYEPLNIPVIEKDVSGKASKAVLSLLVVPIVFNIEHAKCYINEIGSTVANSADLDMYIEGGYLTVDIPLYSGFSPTLKCEGEAVALWGLHSWGWADEFFPDVDLDDIRLKLRVGPFKNVDGLPIYDSAIVDFHADLDLNNTPGFVEDVVDFFRDYRDRVKDKTQEKIRKGLLKETVKEGLGQGMVGFIENQTGDSVERICDVDTFGTSIRFEYEVNVPTSGNSGGGSTPWETKLSHDSTYMPTSGNSGGGSTPRVLSPSELFAR